jgi:hypothetical protein
MRRYVDLALTLNMEAIRSSETSVNAKYTQRRIQEDDILYMFPFDF